MPRYLLAVLLLLCLAAPAAASARPRAEALVDSCEKATIEQDGTGVFIGRMRDDRRRAAHADALHAADAPHVEGPLDRPSRCPASASGPRRRPAARATSTRRRSRTCCRPRATACRCASAGSTPTATGSTRCATARPPASSPTRAPTWSCAGSASRRRPPTTRGATSCSSATTAAPPPARPRSRSPSAAWRSPTRSVAATPGEGTLVTIEAPKCRPGTELSAQADSGDVGRRARRGRQPVHPELPEARALSHSASAFAAGSGASS